MGTNPLLVADLLPLLEKLSAALRVEGVKSTHDGGVPPAVEGAVAGFGGEFGIFAVKKLELC